MIRIQLSSSEQLIEAQITDLIKAQQELFEDDLRPLISRAAGAVISGNITGKGPYSPSPIGRFGSKRARYHRGWVERTHGSSRNRRAGKQDTKKMQQAAKQRDYLKNRVILDTLSRADATTAQRQVSREARATIAAAQRQRDPKAAFTRSIQPGQKDTMNQYLQRSQEGQKLARKAGHVGGKLAAGKMRYGLQSGLLAKAWYDLDAIPSSRGRLSFSLKPSNKTSEKTPNAEALIRSLRRQAGQWFGLMSTPQLIEALRDQGVVSR